jgi:PST family polysaccharide transporter
MALSISINNSALLIFEKIVTIGVSFLTGVLLARIAGAETFGQYAYILSFAGLFAPLCVMGLNNVVTKYIVKYPENSHYYIKASLFVRAIGALLSISLGLFIVWFANNNRDIQTEVIQLLMMQSVQLFFVLEYYFLANNLLLPALKIRVVVLLLSAFLKVLVITSTTNISMLILIHGASYIAIAIGYIGLYRKTKSHSKLKKNVKTRSILAMFHRGKWLLLSGIASVIYLKIDQVMLANYYSAADVGVYAAAAKLSEFWYVFPVLIANAFNPQLIKKYKSNKVLFEQFVLQFLSVLVTCAFTITLLTLLFSDIIIHWVYGAEFEGSIAIVNIHIFATIFIFQRAILSKWLIIKGLYKYSLWTQGIGAIINICLNMAFIPKWGGIGAAWASLIAYMAASYLSLFFSKELRPFAKLMTIALCTWPVKTIQLLHKQRLTRT